MARHYYDTLRECLGRRVLAGEVAAAEVDRFTLQVLQRQYDTSYLDYVRYVVGAMWGAVTPDSCASFAAQQLINHGMHKRCAQSFMVLCS